MNALSRLGLAPAAMAALRLPLGELTSPLIFADGVGNCGVADRASVGVIVSDRIPSGEELMALEV